jgi:flagellin
MGTLSITTNTSALNVQRNLAEANDRSASSLAKLSSGSRVPTARDDAASLAIGSRLEAEVAGLNQASINASQATSMLQIADGALSEVNDVLVRLKSLSVQSSSGQLSDSERALLDSEFQNLLEEIDRISQDTEFNGNQLLNGGDIIASTDELKTGALASAGISLEFDTNKVNGKTDADGNGSYADAGDSKGDMFSISYDETTETITLTNISTGEVTQQNIQDDLNAIAGNGNNLQPGQELEVSFGDLGITVKLDDDFDRTTGFTDSGTVTQTGATPPAFTNPSASLPAGATGSALETILASGNFDAASSTFSLNLTEAGGAVTIDAMPGLEFSVDGGAFSAPSADLVGAGTISVRDSATGEVLFEVEADAIAANGTDSASTLEVKLPTNTFGVQEDVQNTATFDYQVGTGTSASDQIAVTIEGASTTALGINSTTIKTQADAQAAIDEVGAAIDKLQDIRANVGASLSRLDFASSNLSVTIENTESAKSGLLDVDVATETTKYTAEQVIVQAGVSLLAQANQRPNTLLSLLQQ